MNVKNHKWLVWVVMISLLLGTWNGSVAKGEEHNPPVATGKVRQITQVKLEMNEPVVGEPLPSNVEITEVQVETSSVDSAGIERPVIETVSVETISWESGENGNFSKIDDLQRHEVESNKQYKVTITLKTEKFIFKDGVEVYMKKSSDTVLLEGIVKDGPDTIKVSLAFTPTLQGTPTPAPTAESTPTPTVTPTLKPTSSPDASPTIVSTATPAVKPSVSPTALPTMKPTAIPTAEPSTAEPPTSTPTATPTVEPSTAEPSTSTPTSTPTVESSTAEPPTSAPTIETSTTETPTTEIPSTSPVATPPSVLNPPVTPPATYTVTLDANGGEFKDTKQTKKKITFTAEELKQGIDLPKKGEITKKRYILIGWYKGKTRVKEITEPGDVTLKAQWVVNSVTMGDPGGTLKWTKFKLSKDVKLTDVKLTKYKSYVKIDRKKKTIKAKKYFKKASLILKIDGEDVKGVTLKMKLPKSEIRGDATIKRKRYATGVYTIYKITYKYKKYKGARVEAIYSYKKNGRYKKCANALNQPKGGLVSVKPGTTVYMKVKIYYGNACSVSKRISLKG